MRVNKSLLIHLVKTIKLKKTLYTLRSSVVCFNDEKNSKEK